MSEENEGVEEKAEEVPAKVGDKVLAEIRSEIGCPACRYVMDETTDHTSNLICRQRKCVHEGTVFVPPKVELEIVSIPETRNK